jgi:hypothetical protein
MAAFQVITEVYSAGAVIHRSYADLSETGVSNFIGDTICSTTSPRLQAMIRLSTKIVEMEGQLGVFLVVSGQELLSESQS